MKSVLHDGELHIYRLRRLPMRWGRSRGRLCIPPQALHRTVGRNISWIGLSRWDGERAGDEYGNDHNQKCPFETVGAPAKPI
jgi:hypothetical protein